MSEPAIFGAIWRNRKFVALGAILGVLAALAFVLLQGREPVYTATTTVEVVDRSQSSFLSESAETSDRFAATQLLIFRSSGVVSRAAELAVDEAGQPLYTPQEIAEAMTTLVQPGTDVVTVLFVANTEARAVAGANAVAAAYQQIKADTSEIVAASTLARIDAALASVSSEVRRLGDEINNFNPDLLAVGVRIDELVDQLLLVQAQVDLTQVEVNDPDLIKLNTLIAELDSLRLVQDLYEGDPAFVALVQQQDRLVDYSLELTTRRLELQIDQEQAASGVGTVSVASTAELRPPATARFLALGLLAGTLVGAAVAFSLANSRRLVSDPLAVEAILEVPSLGEVPDFAEDYVNSDLPVRDAPRSASAESFRFVVTSLETQLERIPGQLVAFVSSETGDGKSVVVANTAVSAAYAGRRVLVVDADFGNQTVGTTLGVSTAGPGLTNIVSNRSDLRKSVVRLSLPGDASVDYLGRGTQSATALDFFRRAATQEVFEAFARDYDLVLVDTPPLLQVAYGATVSRLCDAVVAVVKHESLEAQVIDLRRRLALVGTPIVGYVYNFAPLREFMTTSDGSMKDIVGDLSHVLPVRGRAGS